jgi:hypothetical protein
MFAVGNIALSAIGGEDREGLTATELASQMVARMTSGMSKQGTKDMQFSCKTAAGSSGSRCLVRVRVRV